MHTNTLQRNSVSAQVDYVHTYGRTYVIIAMTAARNKPKY